MRDLWMVQELKISGTERGKGIHGWPSLQNTPLFCFVCCCVDLLWCLCCVLLCCLCVVVFLCECVCCVCFGFCFILNIFVVYYY